jgi:hypothetical protein
MHLNRAVVDLSYPTGDPISVGWAAGHTRFNSLQWSVIRSTLILTMYQCTKRTADGQSKLSCLRMCLVREIFCFFLLL